MSVEMNQPSRFRQAQWWTVLSSRAPGNYPLSRDYFPRNIKRNTSCTRIWANKKVMQVNTGSKNIAFLAGKLLTRKGRFSAPPVDGRAFMWVPPAGQVHTDVTRMI